MELNPRTPPDFDSLGCPHCPEQRGLDPTLRVELETELSVFLAACPSCQRVYRVDPGGRQRLGEVDIKELALNRVRCPRCRAVGYALSYDFAPENVESYTVLTCQDCSHTFRGDLVAMQ